MFKSYIYLEIRVLLSAMPGVFIEEGGKDGPKDILSAKKEFLKKNNEGQTFSTVRIQPSVLHKVSTFVRATGGRAIEDPLLEHLTGNIIEPPDDRTFTGFSVKLAEGGSLGLVFHQKEKEIHIEEVRIEEDRGRLTRSGGKKASIDWTYAGCPTMRIRTKNEFELGDEAELFLEELYTLLTYLKLVSPESGENSVRCNAYAAIAKYPAEPEYYVKLRNLNSFNFVRKAINSELSREDEILSSGGSIASESRLWNEEQNITESYQDRDTHLERFETVMPEIHTGGLQKTSGDAAIELPKARRERIRKEYGLSRLRSFFICREKDRADYFEQAVQDGAEPLLTAHWMAGELMKILNKTSLSIKQCHITSHKFAQIMQLLIMGKINSTIAKNLLADIAKNGSDVEELIKQPGMTVLSSQAELLPYVRKVLDENPNGSAALKKGEMASLEYLTGLVMKATNGRADPVAVKSLIKQELKVNVIYVLTMGGSITAEKLSDGTVAAGNSNVIKALISKLDFPLPVQVVNVRSMLSEETEPSDWAALISEVSGRIQSGMANGIVVTHGTDTLPYTSALLYWLFSASQVPVVLTASSTIPAEGSEAVENLKTALETARDKKGGVYVVYGRKVLSPLNLKYTGGEKDAFSVWNMKDNMFASKSLLSQNFLSVQQPDSNVMADILNEAANRMEVVKLYPGLPGARLAQSMNTENGIDTVILELYGHGTGNVRNSDYSLKSLLFRGRKNGATFYCTSQQESKVDFREFATSADVWREGAVPMGSLTTESVIALYFAASLVADNSRELKELMENGAES